MQLKTKWTNFRLGWMASSVVFIVSLAAYQSGDSAQRNSDINSDISVRVTPNFVGGDVCKNCHAEQYALWKKSHHDLAMQPANARTVLGDFDFREFTYNGVTSTFLIRDKQYIVTTDGPDGILKDYIIKFTIGVSPLQQYLVELPGGHLQALSIAWDTRPIASGGQRWFHLNSDDSVDYQHPLHWTAPLQNANSMCVECHVTNYSKGYDKKYNRFASKWSEINVACEACHGPGSRHVAWANRVPGWQDYDSGSGLLETLSGGPRQNWIISENTGNAIPKDSESVIKEIDICARCHSRRASITESASYGKSLLENYRPALLRQSLYHVDGQIKDEVYVYGSFLQSKMYQAGVRCNDCHEPHSLKLREPQERVCFRCHLEKKYASRDHHRHAPDSTGANCLNCHMPETVYMEVDSRRDHSIRIPQPELSEQFGTPNACNQCHTGKSVSWAINAMAAWRPSTKTSAYRVYAAAFDAARNNAVNAERLLMGVASDKKAPDIIRATAVAELGAFLGLESAKVVQQALHDNNALIRLAALGSLSKVSDTARFRVAAHLLEDPLRAVRIEAGRLLVAAPRNTLNEKQLGLLQNAINEYIAYQNLSANRPEANLNLGLMYSKMGNLTLAQEAYRRAIKLDPAFVAAYVNLADIYREKNNDQKARQILREGLQHAPTAASMYHALGLVLVRQQRIEEALGQFKLAVELRPDNMRYVYAYGLALKATGERELALRVMQRGHQISPNDRTILVALINMLREQSSTELARTYAAKLLILSPQDATSQRLFLELSKAP